MTGSDITFRNYIRNSSDDYRVRQDLTRMYENFRTEGAGLIDDRTRGRMYNRDHAEEMSRAMQRIERMAGNDGNFKAQGLVDMAQQEYDGEARGIHGRRFQSADHDGFQDYYRADSGNLAMAQRAAAHTPIDRYNAAEASNFMQQREVQALRQGDAFGSDRIDRMQERYERNTDIAGTRLSQDFDGRGVSTADHFRNAMMMFGWLRYMN